MVHPCFATQGPGVIHLVQDGKDTALCGQPVLSKILESHRTVSCLRCLQLKPKVMGGGS